ncbi:MarR family transcriptional regulator [Sorangium sp. So ce1504]
MDRFVRRKLEEDNEGVAALHGLQPGQDVLLRQLCQSDGLSQSALIERLGVEPPTVTKALGRLEKAGLVVRRRDPNDARVSRVYRSGTSCPAGCRVKAAPWMHG